MSEGRAWTQDDVIRSVHAPLPRLWRTHDRLQMPAVLGEAPLQGRVLHDRRRAGRRDVPQYPVSGWPDMTDRRASVRSLCGQWGPFGTKT